MATADKRKALIVGIDDYGANSLKGCVNDANAMEEVLKRNGNGEKNFDCFKLISTDRNITLGTLRNRIESLFKGECDLALLYFSGHGFLDSVGGILVSQDASKNDPGLSMDWVVKMANQSKAKEVLIILDCCYAGALGSNPTSTHSVSELRKGITILAATTEDDHARERMGHGLFTSILVNGLKGQAADLLGHVSTAGLFNLAESLFSAWEQRPIFKCHISGITPIRFCEPKVERSLLRSLPTFFPEPNTIFHLNPAHEITSKNSEEDKVKVFKQLGRLERNGIVRCKNYDSMYEEAMHNGGCILTDYGKFVRLMAEKNQL